ncbi:MAG: ABC transporter permease, partial [Candidatus Thalassarchaeaceae archaeon]|nr:ABC transporter permease [Candidatus Thalassarchaeaceae archaeon]
VLGVIIDRAVYRGFRLKDANPQVMMIASLGIALILRSLYFLRFSSAKIRFSPDADFSSTVNKWELPTTKIRLNLGERDLAEGRTYSQLNCEQTGVDAGTGEPILTRIVSESSKPPIEVYDLSIDCVTPLTSNLSYANGSLPAVVFLSVALLVLLLNKTRLGMRMRAVADNPELAASSGINVERVQQTSAFLSAGVTGVGGAIFSVTLLFNPVTGFQLLLPAFAVIVLGTIGSVNGAIVASLLVGFVRASSTPILTGVGFQLDRSGYSAMAGVMPYIFLIAILIVLPKGLGDAWERWNIERERKRGERTRRELEPRLVAALAFLPTGIFGTHQWANGRSDKAQNFSIVVFGSYVIHRLFGFVSRNSFAEGSCSQECQSSGANSNLDIFTGSEGAPLSVQDSPYFSDSPSGLDQKWYELMETELQLANIISDISEILWPWVPIFLWAIAIWQGIQILRGMDDYSKEATTLESMMGSFGFTSIRDAIREPFSKASNRLSEINRVHSRVVKNFHGSISTSLSNIAGTTKTKLGGLLSNIDSDRLQSLRDPYGREGERGSLIAFSCVLLIIIWLIWWLPINSGADTFRFDKMAQTSNVISTISVFVLMSFALNLHTGYTGMVNFGIIFFVGIGSITVCILSASERYNGYGWGILPATIFAVLLAAAIGWALAYPTARLRTDYFAIVTISLGEMVRIMLSAEPLLRTGPVKSAIGIGSYPLPLKEWWYCGGVKTGPEEQFISPDYCKWANPALDTPAVSVQNLLSLHDPAPYSLVLAVISVASVIIVWIILSRILASPWGRILKAIREDEEVAQHHGHDVLRHKAASLALGAAICALAGAIWAWKLSGISPVFMSPAGSTFLVWAAFIIGGSANNRGMVIGASIIVMSGYVFQKLAVASSPDLPLYDIAMGTDDLFIWLVTEQWEVTRLFLAMMVIGIVSRASRLVELGAFGAMIFGFTALFMDGIRAVAPAANYAGEITLSGGPMSYVRLILVGSLMLFSLIFNPKGLIPEIPSRPERQSGGEN